LSGLLVVTPPGPDAATLCANLTARGFDVHTAPNGAAAVDVASRRQPHVILMDPSLSAMDRWHAVKRLNTDNSTSRIPVLTLASDATSPAGLQRVLGKIERTLGRLPQPRSKPQRNSGPPSSAPPSPTPTPSLGATPRMQPPPRKVPPVRVKASSPPTPPATVRVEAPATGRTPPASTRAGERAEAVTDRGAEVRTDRPPPAGAMGLPAAPTPPLPPRRPVSEASRLLVVDDNALNRDMLSRRLRRRGYDVEVAEDGEQALSIIERTRIDLVLLDWMMPGLSGIDVLERLRADHTPVELPVIMATAKTEADDVVEALKAQANDYVTKPLNFDVVHARIRTQLNLVKAHQELKVSERRFRALLENTGDMIVQYTSDGEVTYVSPASRILLGWEPEDLKKRSFYEWIHPLDRRALLEQRKNNPTLPPAFTFIARMQRQDATWIWVETSARLLREQGGQLIQAACRDVTEHMETLPGDEPPLPLGGDIMAHPGWRGGSAKPAPERSQRPSPGGEDPPSVEAAPAAAPPPPEPRATPVVMVSLLSPGAGAASREEILAAVAEQLDQVLADGADS